MMVCSALKIETVYFAETVVSASNIVWRYSPEYQHQHILRDHIGLPI
jgi:hypothetical protein